jgi:hypothetical protein
MTPEQRLTTDLWLAGLAPADTMMLAAIEGPFYYAGKGQWRPARRWDDAMPLALQYRIDIFISEQPRRITASKCIVSEFARTDKDIPAAICRLALRLRQERLAHLYGDAEHACGHE